MAFGGENADSYYDEGVTASMRGDLLRAVQCFEKAIHLDKTYLSAIHQLGKCYLRMGQAPKAAELLSRAVSKRPDQIPCRLDLGYALLATGRTQEARQCFEHIVSVEPGNPRAMLGLAHTCFHEANWRGAVHQAQAALNQSAANFAALFMLGRAAKLAGDQQLAQNALGRADTLIQKSVELNPNQPEGYYLRGEVSFALEDFASSLDHFRAAETKAEPEKYYTAFGENFSRIDIMIKQALCYQRLGRVDRAKEIGIGVLQLDPNHKLGNALKNL